MTDKDMLFLAGLAGFAWWTYVFCLWSGSIAEVVPGSTDEKCGR